VLRLQLTDGLAVTGIGRRRPPLRILQVNWLYSVAVRMPNVGHAVIHPTCWPMAGELRGCISNT
jgi:hypothetical protein